MLIRSIALCTILATVPTARGAQPKRVPEPVDFSGLNFQGFSEEQSALVAPRKRRVRRCARCHAKMDPNPTIRYLEDAPHVEQIEHGQGRMWCLTCHDETDRQSLVTLIGEKVDIDKAYVICGSCHADRQRDWYFGGHGKRIENWYGERVVYNCTHCHDPHDPTITARQPSPPPGVRIGLDPMGAPDHKIQHPWGTGFTGHENDLNGD